MLKTTSQISIYLEVNLRGHKIIKKKKNHFLIFLLFFYYCKGLNLWDSWEPHDLNNNASDV